jgi:flagellar assembly factor FliW
MTVTTSLTGDGFVGRLPLERRGAAVDDAAGDEPSVLRFSDGIPGFADAHGFMLSDLTDDGVFQMLTCVEDPELSLVVASPWLFFPSYTPDLPEGDRRVLGIEQPEDAVLFCSVVADEDEDVLMLNLRAPFVANAHTLVARQVVLDEDLPLRAPVVPEG